MSESDFWNIEIKETEWNFTYEQDENGKIHINRAFKPPTYKYLSETDYYLGVCYEDWPKPGMKPDEVYRLAVTAKYYIYDTRVRQWCEIGENGTAEDFLKFLSGLKDSNNFNYSWPECYENYIKFNRTDLYQVLPWRELIRRHFDQRALIEDRDLVIHKTYLRNK